MRRKADTACPKDHDGEHDWYTRFTESPFIGHHRLWLIIKRTIYCTACGGRW